MKIMGNKKSGITIIEVMISASLGVMILTIVYVSFVTGQKVHRKGALNAELSQNGRIALDRISREMRQAEQIITTLQPIEPDPPQTDIKFKDGHISTVQYIRYYLSGQDIKREQGHYFFSTDPDSWVYHDAVDGGGQPATYTVDSDQIIAQNISTLNFYGEKNIYIELTVEKDNQKIELRTENFGRNL